ncbi:MAG: efflux RND transporter periplasmic adaptor subunit, partial [Oscillospiraceae bacterium]|nr:efflux RND transporter periplasmic adaptor subunit [Oscillospiraceae bacterium]
MSAKIKIIAAAVLLIVLASCSDKSSEYSVPELLRPVNAPVDVVQVTRGDVVQLNVFEGTVIARNEALRFMATDAPVSEVYCAPGDFVSAGTLLAVMDKTALNAQIDMYSSMLEFNEATWTNANTQSEVAIARSVQYGSAELAEQQQKQLDFDIKSQQIERERLQFKIAALKAKEPDYEITAPFDGTVINIAELGFGNYIAP